MDPSRWRRIESIFEAVIEIGTGERLPALAELCGGDEDLQREVAELLAADAGHGLLDIARAKDQALPAVGELAGPYQLLGVLGEGGSSTVYRALRADRRYQQEVAVKVLRSGLRGPGGPERFRQEMQILADLDHPAIARLLDGGETRDAPYLVMELVDGLPITDYCTQKALPLAARLELFLQVLAAVHYAHQRLIVHRDLKPANILVREDGQPKLLDFGIAKLMRPGAHLFGGEPTRADLLLVTPSYASPEQLLGRGITTASDVYSLGVVLYRLLSERRPYDVDNADLGTILRVVCETEPPPPSQVAPESSRQLAGDLDHIVAKAMAKNPERRYPSADALAADLRRYLRGEPVEARAAGLTYRLGKFLRQHRLAVAAALALLAVILGALVAVSLEVRRTAAALAVAEAERGKAQAVNDLLVSLLTAADPGHSGQRDVLLIEAIRQAENSLATALAGQPEIEGTVRRVLGTSYRSLGELDHAEGLLTRALELAEKTGDRRGATLARGELSEVLAIRGDLAGARRLLLEALGSPNGSPAEGGAAPVLLKSPEALLAAAHLILVEIDLGHPEVAESYFQAALAAAEQNQPANLKLQAQLFSAGATVATARGNLATAVERSGQAAALARQAGGDLSRELAQASFTHGAALRGVGRYAEAEAQLREALRIHLALLGPDHPKVAAASHQLGAVLRAQNRGEEAEALYLDACRILRQASGGRDPQLAAVLVTLGNLYLQQRRIDEAFVVLHEALEILRPLYHDDHPRVLQALESLARIHQLRGELAKAEGLLRQVLAIRLRDLGEEHFLVAYSRGHLGELLLGSGRAAEAEKLFRPAVDLLRRKVQKTDLVLANIASGLGLALHRLQRNEEAVAVLEKVAVDAPELVASHATLCRRVAETLAQSLLELRRAEAARGWRARHQSCPAEPQKK